MRYHRVLSSHAKVRAEVVPRAEELPVQLPLFAQPDGSADRNLDVLAPEPRKKPWAWLLRHVFEIDVSTCPRCGGATRWLEAATKPDAIARLLAKHGLGPRPPPKPPPKGQLRLALPKPGAPPAALDGAVRAELHPHAPAAGASAAPTPQTRPLTAPGGHNG